MLYRFAADVVVIVHLAFVAFAVGGALLVARWRALAWAHVPAAVWAALIEFGGWICPLTPLEQHLRRLGGEAGYSGGFVEHYLLPILYPGGLTRNLQFTLGALVLFVNVAVYAWILRRAVRSR